jgi:acyl-CoA hydrolase
VGKNIAKVGPVPCSGLLLHLLISHVRSQGINEGRIRFADKHLSMFPQDLTYGFYTKVGAPRIQTTSLKAVG